MIPLLRNRRATRAMFQLLAGCAALFVFSAQAGIAERAQRSQAAGVDVIVYPMDVPNVVTVMGVMPLGDAKRQARATNAAVPELTVMLLQAGTKRRDKFQIDETLSSIGAEVDVSAGGNAIDIYAHSLTRDLGTVVGLLAEQLREPAFTQAELDKAKVQLEAMLRDAGENADARASEALQLALFQASSPNAPIPREERLKAIPSATLEQIRQFHKDYFGPAHMTLVFVGDVDAKDVNGIVGKSFRGWTGGVDYVRTHEPATAVASQVAPIQMADKASVSVYWGQPTGLRFDDPDYLPLSLGVAVLGSGFTSRLMSAIRAKEGLTYGISARLVGSDVASGGFMVNTTFAPSLLDKGLASTQRELQSWWQDGITEAELVARKKNLAGSYQVRLGHTAGMAGAMIGTVKRGVDLGWLDRYPQQIQETELSSVNAAIRRHTDPAKLIEVRAGTFGAK